MAKLLFLRYKVACRRSNARFLSNIVESGPCTNLYTRKGDATNYRIPLNHEDEKPMFWATNAEQWTLGVRQHAPQFNTQAKKHDVKPVVNIAPFKHLNYEHYSKKDLKQVSAFSEFSDYIPHYELEPLSFRKDPHVGAIKKVWKGEEAGSKIMNDRDVYTGRGFSHVRDIGKSFGPPLKVSKDGTLCTEYDTRFNSKIIQMDYRCRWFAKYKQAGFAVAVAVGNGNGLMGVGVTFHPKLQDGLIEAKQFAYQQLVHFPMLENRGIPYTTRGRYHNTELHAIPMPPYGDNKAHRVVKILLDLAGYKGVAVKLFGRNQPQGLVKAFFVTFQNFDTYQEQADSLGRYVVKFDPQTYFKPTLLAAPKDDSNPVPYSAEIHASSQRMFKNRTVNSTKL